ncbi:unnamed protein product [Hymenolepis diminuta]|uniref:Uncharacterized protein n=1 Tax=Hymenolepis diminuta TaxID=6216 RepID=A0A564YKB6_HYMDI|nr:unnamed protein product [Hymenolepis diminuta]
MIVFLYRQVYSVCLLQNIIHGYVVSVSTKINRAEAANSMIVFHGRKAMLMHYRRHHCSSGAMINKGNPSVQVPFDLCLINTRTFETPYIKRSSSTMTSSSMRVASDYLLKKR